MKCIFVNVFVHLSIIPLFPVLKKDGLSGPQDPGGMRELFMYIIIFSGKKMLYYKDNAYVTEHFTVLHKGLID